MRVPADIEFAIREWSNADGPEERDAWAAIGRAIEAYVATRVAEAAWRENNPQPDTSRS